MDGMHLHNSNNNSISPPTLHRNINIRIVKIGEIITVGDIRIPKCTRSPNHFTYFFIPGIENFLNAQDLLIISPISSYLELKTCFKQGTKYLGQKHHEYHQGWYVGYFVRMHNFNITNNCRVQMSKFSHFFPFFFKIFLLKLRANNKSFLNDESHQSIKNKTLRFVVGVQAQ
jgi:hypothetical protein